MRWCYPERRFLAWQKGQPAWLTKKNKAMARPTNLTLCSFCGKSHAEVKKLIAGPGVYICDNCVILCKQVLDKELAAQLKKHKPRVSIAKPPEIRRQLDLFCVGQ